MKPKPRLKVGDCWKQEFSGNSITILFKVVKPTTPLPTPDTLVVSRIVLGLKEGSSDGPRGLYWVRPEDLAGYRKRSRTISEAQFNAIEALYATKA